MITFPYTKIFTNKKKIKKIFFLNWIKINKIKNKSIVPGIRVYPLIIINGKVLNKKSTLINSIPIRLTVMSVLLVKEKNRKGTIKNKG